MGKTASLLRTLAAVGFTLAAVAGAFAQFGGTGIPDFPQTLPPSTVLGRSGLSAGPVQAIPFSTFVGQLTPLVPTASFLLIDKGTVGTGTVTFTVSGGTKQKLTVSGALSIAFAGWPAAGTYGEIEIQLINGGSNVTWATVNWLLGDGTTSTTFSDMGVVLNPSGTNWIVIWSTDGGATLYGRGA